jgi:hypothetical protein
MHAENPSVSISFYFDVPFFGLLGNPVVNGWSIQEGEEETAMIIRIC